MLQKFFLTIERTPLSIVGWVSAFCCIVLIRSFLENFSGRVPGSVMSTDGQTLIHYGLFYVATIMLVMVVLQLVTRRPMEVIAKVALFGFLIVLTPPLVDVVLVGPNAAPMMYLLGTPADLWQYFTTFFTAESLPGITRGIRLEFFIILVTIWLYVQYATQSLWRAVTAVAITYCLLFVCISLPAWLPGERSFGWLTEIETSLVGTTAYHPAIMFSTFSRTYEMYFNVALAQVWYVISFTVASYIFFSLRPRLWIAVVKNARPERIVHYLAMIAFGVFLAHHVHVIEDRPLNFFDMTTLVSLGLAFIAAWMFAVGTNDIVDAPADSVTNQTRPLVTQTITVSDMKTANGIFLSLALVGGYVTGHVAFFMILVFSAIYYVYSCPPLHLKRFPIINAFCIAVATLTAVLAGFYTVSTDLTLGVFPPSALILILVAYTCIANVKDIKDITSDRAAGVYTIPVLIGEKYGVLTVWGLVTVALCFVPVLFPVPGMWGLTIATSIAAYTLLHKQPFCERFLFGLYFLYLTALALLLVF